MAKYKQKEVMDQVEVYELPRPRRYGGRRHTYKPIPKIKGCKDC